MTTPAEALAEAIRGLASRSSCGCGARLERRCSCGCGEVLAFPVCQRCHPDYAEKLVKHTLDHGKCAEERLRFRAAAVARGLIKG